MEWHWASFNILKPCSSELDGSLHDVNPSTAENAHAIANRTKFRQDTNLYALDTFVVTPMSKPGMCGAREHDEQQTIAEARGISSFSQLVNPFGLFVHCFVSHFWGHNFTSTVTALELWADSNYDKMTSEKEALVYWICLFALNQHDVAEEVGENPQQGPFNAALAQATGGAVMVLDEEVKPFARFRMINTSLVGGCFSHPPDYVMALSANLEPPGL